MPSVDDFPPKPSPSSPVLAWDAVRKTYGSVIAIDDVSLDVSAGEVVSLIGPSGCGKSTLLRMASGLIGPDRGEVRIEGQPLSSGELPQARRRLGYVIQKGGLFPHLTARNNVSLMPNQLGWSAERLGERIVELAELTRLPLDLLDRYPGELSGGQAQRVSLMRALVLDPSLLLLDEPLGALDPLVRADLQTDLKAIFAALKKTVLLVTHDLAEAAWFSDRIVLMNAGRIAQEGSLEHFRNDPASEFVSRFVTAQARVVGV